MPDQNKAVSAAVEDLGFVARNLRAAGCNDEADAVDSFAAALTANPAAAPATADVSTAAAHRNPVEVINVTVPAAAPVDVAYEPTDIADEDEDDEFEPVNVEIRFDAVPAASGTDVIEALEGALIHIGTYDITAVNTSAGTATVNVTEPGTLPLDPGAVLVSGTTFIAGTAVMLTASVPDEDGALGSFADAVTATDEMLDGLNEFADLIGVDHVEAPAQFQVSFTRDGLPVGNAAMRSVLDTAAVTLRHLGELAVTNIDHTDTASVVDYAVLESGGISTAALNAQLVGWGGTVSVPGVGRVTATLNI